MRCPRCGSNNLDDRQTCWRCGLQLLSEHPLPSTVAPALGQHVPLTATTSQTAQSLQAIPQAQHPAQRPPSQVSIMVRALQQTLFAPTPALTGTVITMEPAHEEPADWNWPRFFNRMLLLVEFLGLPLLLLWTLLRLGPISIILAILALVFLFKFASPTGMFNSLRILRFLNPFARGERVPVQYFRVRDGSGRECIVRRKGVLDGQVMAGDEVALWGRFRNGILQLSHGRNVRTRASLVLSRNSSWAFLALHLAILATLLALFYEPIKQTLGVFI